MVSQAKLIKQGIYLTDSLFDEIIKRLSKGVKSSDTLEAFLNKTKDYTMNNPLVLTGYKDELLEIILKETNNHRFSRPAQKELTRLTIENRVGDLIVDVGEDVKNNVRDIVKHGYNNGLSQDEIAENISHRVTTIKNTRARTIARTEIARTATASDYVINKERGATHFTVDCRDTCCDICRKDYNFGKVEYTIDQVEMLPPRHPNCRCFAMFTIKEESTPVQEPTPEQLKKNLKPGEREKYNQYKRNIERQREWLKSNPDASSDEVAKHRKRLAFLEKKFEELRVKALGGKGTGKPNPKPKSEPKPTPKPKPEPKPEPEKEPVKTEMPTQEQLHNNLTKKELQEWKNHKTEVDWANKILNGKDSTDKQKAYAQKRLDTILPRFNELNNKALGLTPKTKTKTTKSKTKKKSNSKKKDEFKLDKPKGTRLTKDECDSLTFEQLADHHNAKYNGLGEGEYGKQYHIFEQTFDNGETFKLYFEKGAVNSYKKGEVATANEIIHEVFMVPEALRKETNDIYFKNTQAGRVKNFKGKFASFKGNVGGHNVSHNRSLRSEIVKEQSKKFKGYDDPNHRIGINPKSFKKLKDFLDIIVWRDTGDSITSWKHIIHHEFMHSIQDSRKIWRNGLEELHERDDYQQIDKEENYFTKYANTMVSESFAEHGGYVSYMLANPEEQSKKISIHHYDRDENNKIVSIDEKIDFEEYKKRYPKHYKYFVDLIKNGASKYETK